MKRLMLALLVTALPTASLAFETRAQAAWVYDVTTGTVLLDKNAQAPLPPASMSKLMTLNMLFEALHDGRVTMDTTFPVSEKAWRMGGSKMFVEPADRPSVEELIHGIIINSGNDACVVVAEGLGGTEENFARMMNERAAALGLSASHFANASGWPHPEHRMSMHDLGVLAVRLITEFPELYQNFALTNFNYKDRVPSNANNRNPLLALEAGDWHADGLKTGHTQEAGYGLTGSAVSSIDNRRVVFVLSGLQSEADRAAESEAVVNYAFRQFTQKNVVRANQRVGTADVWMGGAEQVGLVAPDGVSLLVPAQAQNDITAEVVYTGPIEAPVTKGQELGQLIVRVPGMEDHTVPLVAESDVAQGGFGTRLSTAARVLADRFLAADQPAS
ncbi:D-alanyl-D-alanine carboxypeptidase family protein [Falsirhodobacter halotolerans]|uniref:D-alanyl-D-alanine carboxypeptidase family protein n=1 Tax=Falsirhodobacter halotolerans TaxID=1146892 RepID=UPI001FD29094|nr:D-alanyl-D-alanine carboxypeptidase family protein [Falsirhodobacter halotolerans]MCJ8139927.1 D-alanyl-D-alanine carboxypeptidase [Falsirhodobacter halotolerans]